MDNLEEAEPRRQRLDDLFADEPFLSPTMKARRLHEKLQEMETNAAFGDGELPQAAFVGVIPMNWPGKNEFPISLADARARLRQPYNGENEPTDSLPRLRDSLLTPWLAAMQNDRKD